MERLPRIFSVSGPAFRAACGAARRLREAGFEAGLVGGSVRDLLLGRVPADFDLVTTATPEQLETLFPGRRLVGVSFGVSLIDVEGFRFETATAREERNYLDGRHPELVRYTDSLECDMARRDFTVNAGSLVYGGPLKVGNLTVAAVDEVKVVFSAEDLTSQYLVIMDYGYLTDAFDPDAIFVAYDESGNRLGGTFALEEFSGGSGSLVYTVPEPAAYAAIFAIAAVAAAFARRKRK